MSTTAPECRVCGIAMDAGLMLDQTSGRAESPLWINGIAETGFFGHLKVGDRARIPVVTFRCPTCGRLESFAQTV